MRCSLKRLTCVVKLFLIPFVSFGITLSEIEGLIRKKVKELYGDRVRIRGITVYARTVPKADRVSVRVSVREGHPRGRATLVFEKDGKVRFISAGLDLLWRCRVLVASENMGAGERLYPWLLEERYVYLERCDGGLPPLDSLINYTLIRGIGKGERITRSNIRKTPLVKFGEEVKVTLRRGGLEITVPGRVLDTGFYGDTVRVRVGFTGKVIRARVVGEGSVEVK
ncbi:MAG: flagellar basal body P-ring formation chaperone FlgA [Aquificota bacterium]|nr:flagellar basal body P-ring formation chaperone FlgA [Aquificota bacterium]